MTKKEQEIVLAQAEGSGLRLIAEERIRQIKVEGYDQKHDDDVEDAGWHSTGQIAQAAATYALSAAGPQSYEDLDFDIEDLWPWPDGTFKPATPQSRYERAKMSKLDLIEAQIKDCKRGGALLAAEIDRLNREKERIEADGQA